MKKSLVLAMAMALGVTASAYAANPFSDVPAGHWAYDSVNKLAAAGVVDGFPDGTYGGDKLMTRYEMAQIVAKAMAKGANVDKLAAEFADELDTLGVRVANLEEKADNVKITGETRLRYWDYDGGKNVGSKTQLRSRIWVKGQVNDDWSYTGMLENIQTFAGAKGSDTGEEDTKFQRAYVNGKLGGMAVQAGRYNFTDFNGGLLYDTRMDGVQVSYGKDVKLTVGAGKAANASDAADVIAHDMAYAQLGAKLGVVDAKVGYYKFDDQLLSASEAVRADNEIWTAGVAFDVVKNLKLDATYLQSDYDENGCDDKGYAVGLSYKGAKAAQPGSWGMWARYYDQPLGTQTTGHTVEAAYDFGVAGQGFEGYGVGVDYAFAKNIVAQVKYYDLEAQTGAKEEKTLYSQLLFTF